MGIYGARVLHLNRFFNLTKHAPGEIERPEPFPLSVADPGPLYEKGIDSHNWLYIATRTGLVRSIISVLPDSVFRSRLSELRENPYFSFRPPAFIGYSFDTPRSVVTLEALSRVIEPVIINVDAGYFIDGNDPKKVVTMLRNACPDIRGIVIVRSSDEPDVDERMTGKLQQFHDLWQRL